MKKNEIIESGLLELYALGKCTIEESKSVEAHLSDDDVWNEFVAIQEGLFALANANKKEPSKALKSKIFAAIDAVEQKENSTNTNSTETQKEGKVIPLNASANVKSSTKVWLRAAVIALLISVGFNMLFMGEIANKNQELTALRSVNEVLAQEANVIKSSYAKTEKVNRLFTEGVVVPVQLNSTNKKQQSAVVYWDKTSGQALINAKNLPQIDDNKSYQLWCLVDGVPVDMGVIPTNMVGANELAMLKVTDQKPDAFAITIEPFGGQASPTLEQLMVLGNVVS